MQKEGFSYGDIKRIFTPIGLAIGGKTPGEIAISIAAEMIKKKWDDLIC
ncbi:XdhC family protein [endosymbiont 'TC1' of Trimyema compressum]|nr:XdhC family protein [endosymbiont 'TC1' of Trimyema compressum]